jgi:hypothetical protein
MTGINLDTIVELVRAARALDVLVYEPEAMDHLARKLTSVHAGGRQPHPQDLADAKARVLHTHGMLSAACCAIFNKMNGKLVNMCKSTDAMGGVEHLERCADAVLGGGLNVLLFPSHDPDDGAA